jgi:hypothetical protein
MFGHTISLNVSTYHCVNLRIVQAEVIGVDPKDVNVPVVGGHAGVTILPILSQVRSSLLTVLYFSFLLSIMYYGICQKQAFMPSDVHNGLYPAHPIAFCFS